ncbi:MAG: hypothetical protein MZV63_15275 [Marinilabiliales bacterium]|nr:hypothetical protein [Marinilabiliales bacterium]
MFPYDIYSIQKDEAYSKIVYEKHQYLVYKRIIFPENGIPISGDYELVLTAEDDNGKKIEFRKQFTLYGNDMPTTPGVFFEVTADKTSYSVGDVAVIYIWAAADGALLFETNRKPLVDDSRIAGKKGVNSVYVPIYEEDIGGFSITVYTVINRITITIHRFRSIRIYEN